MDEKLLILQKRKAELEAALAIAKKARDEADGKMQSRYDTQKEDAAQDMAMYEGLIANIDKLIIKLSSLQGQRKNSDTVEIGNHVVIEFSDGYQEEFLLLDSLGGVDLGEYQTLSTESPVGNAILGARVGETIEVKLGQGRRVVVRVVSID